MDQSIEDNRIAAQWVAEQGFADPVVIGHSNGGMLAVQHTADHPRTPALVLLSAHCGGREMVPLACKAGLLAGNQLESITEKAKSLVDSGKGRELLLLPGWWYVTSAESFLDLANCPDVLALAPRIRCPVLYLRGDREPRELYPAEAFAERCPGRCEVQVVPDCDHFYVRREMEIARRVSSWLGPVLQER
jgi:pimeloyl-ACP methyl ester carboxylesterase